MDEQAATRIEALRRQWRVEAAMRALLVDGQHLDTAMLERLPGRHSPALDSPALYSPGRHAPDGPEQRLRAA